MADTQSLIKIYQRAYMEILKRLSRKLKQGNVIGYELALLTDIEDILSKLDKEAYKWIQDNIPASYQEGQRLAEKEYTRAKGELPVSIQIAGIHQEAVMVLAQNLYDDLHEAHLFVGRKVRDLFRDSALNTVTTKVSTGQTIKEAKKNLIQNLLDQGVTAFQDSRGRLWRLDSYAQMVVRSTTAEATNWGTMNQLQTELNHDLVQMTDHIPTCPICAPLQGRVYSISGSSTDYPPLFGKAFGSYANIHPNCAHRLSPYFAELANDPAKDKRMSNRPFDTDPRSEKERQAYDEARKKKQDARNAKREWEKLKATLPNVPSIGPFTRMWKAKSKGYKELKTKYKAVING
jgi:hypothetical protein